MWTMNITLSIDEHLAERAREVARAHGTSLNDMIRRYLESVTGIDDRAAMADRYVAFERPRQSADASRTWRREDAYEGRG